MISEGVQKWVRKVRWLRKSRDEFRREDFGSGGRKWVTEGRSGYKS